MSVYKSVDGIDYKQCSICGEWKEINDQNYYRHKSHFRGVESCCTVCASARRKTVSARNKAEREALRPGYIRRETEPQLQLQPDLDKAIGDFLNAKKVKSRSVWYSYRATLKGFGQFLAKNELQQWPIDPDACNAWLADCQDQGKTPATVLSHWKIIKVWIRWLSQRKRADVDILELVERPAAPRLIPRFVKPESMAKLLETLEQAAAGGNWKEVQARCLVILALDTGARVGELSGLTLDRVDFEQSTITLTQTKSRKDRIAVFSEQAAAVLRAWLDCRQGLDIPASLQTVFVSRQRGFIRFSTWGMRRTLQRYQCAAGVERFKFHQLRATYAVFATRAGQDILDVSRQMGHSSLAITQIYVSIDDTGRAARHQQHSPLSYVGGAQ